MNIIKPYAEILTDTEYALKIIEKAARTCYKSEDKTSEDSDKRIVKMLIDSGHEAMLEHFSVSVKFVVNRGVSHELVRHRVASFAQESQRYCNYSKDKFGDEITVIKPCFFDEETDERFVIWKNAVETSERKYKDLLNFGATPQEARDVLPNAVKTEVVMTANLREWRHFFKLRACDCTGKAHPQMKEVTIPLLEEFKNRIPVVFDDLIPAQQ